jgi:hypothetical protein
VRATPPSIDETPTGLATVVALAVVVELVAIEGDEQEYLLAAFRIRDTYRSLRLSEPLLERLADVLRPDSKRNPIYYYLGGLDADGENTRRLERVLARLGDKYKKHEPIE